MIQLEDTLISEEILTEKFVCDTARCRGICCVEGDSGAPLAEEEKTILKDIYPRVEPYMTVEGIRTVKTEGYFVNDPVDGEPVTPIIRGRDCAYLCRDASGAAQCAIEKAFCEKKITWKKPISCHLYPIRLSRLFSLTVLNYHRWWVCSDACRLGKELNVPVYRFLKEPLIRRFGRDWYEKLEILAREFEKQFPRK